MNKSTYREKTDQTIQKTIWRKKNGERRRRKQPVLPRFQLQNGLKQEVVKHSYQLETRLNRVVNVHHTVHSVLSLIFANTHPTGVVYRGRRQKPFTAVLARSRFQPWGLDKDIVGDYWDQLEANGLLVRTSWLIGNKHKSSTVFQLTRLCLDWLSLSTGGVALPAGYGMRKRLQKAVSLLDGGEVAGKPGNQVAGKPGKGWPENRIDTIEYYINTLEKKEETENCSVSPTPSSVHAPEDGGEHGALTEHSAPDSSSTPLPCVEGQPSSADEQKEATEEQGSALCSAEGQEIVPASCNGEHYSPASPSSFEDGGVCIAPSIEGTKALENSILPPTLNVENEDIMTTRSTFIRRLSAATEEAAALNILDENESLINSLPHSIVQEHIEHCLGGQKRYDDLKRLFKEKDVLAVAKLRAFNKHLHRCKAHMKKENIV